MRTRKNYEPEFKKEIAEGYYTKRLSAQDIEAKGIKMNNVHRWMKQLYGPGGRRATSAEVAPPAAPPAAPLDSVAPAPDVHTLSLRKIKRGANRRYREKDKSTIMSALLQLPVPEVSERTGVNPATLYLWKAEAEKQKNPEAGGALVVLPEKTTNASVPANGARHSPAHRTAEVLVNPETTEGLLDGIRKMEGFVNLTKVVESKIKKFRAGIIDFDEDDHLLCRAYLQITGGKQQMRARK